MRSRVKRLLRRHGYPPDKAEKALETVIKQAEARCGDWTNEPDPVEVARRTLASNLERARQDLAEHPNRLTFISELCVRAKAQNSSRLVPPVSLLRDATISPEELMPSMLYLCGPRQAVFELVFAHRGERGQLVELKPELVTAWFADEDRPVEMESGEPVPVDRVLLYFRLANSMGVSP